VGVDDPEPAPAGGTEPPRPPSAQPPQPPHKAAAPPPGPPDPPPPPDRAVPAFITALQASLPGAIAHVSFWVGDWTLIVSRDRLLDVLRSLRDAPETAFDFCSDVTAVDWPARAERFDVVYCLCSTRDRRRVRVKVRAAESDAVPSVTGLWPAANWLEREVFDMFGVRFEGHPDLRRILMPEEWQGHPQRKDYPLEGPGELLLENPIDWLRLRE
jgi:NADH-quinone oxidoreductase subunit C